MLLVITKNDMVSEAFIGACNRLQMEVRTALCLESAVDAMQHPLTGGHNIIIVDGRFPRVMDPEPIARYL